MKTAPNEAELAAIAIALRSRIAAEPFAPARAISRWAQDARRDGVRANVPSTWRG